MAKLVYSSGSEFPPVVVHKNVQVSKPAGTLLANAPTIGQLWPRGSFMGIPGPRGPQGIQGDPGVLERDGVRVKAATDRGPTTANTSFPISWSTARWEDSEFWDAANPTRIKPPRPGLYKVGFQCAILGVSGPATDIQAVIRRVSADNVTKAIIALQSTPTLANGKTYWTNVNTEEQIGVDEWFECAIYSLVGTVTAKAADNYGIEAWCSFAGD